ncbi:hypothetical protein BHU72_01620 [Desulfuribacillus stibiiarsenatis]|uniref:YdhG-like domain-containing protein n=1 Tax=Desulfuribacillus stibiiarsenatis TaxID=1390249 RepID=A0A1E5LA25_9FIRM|nr:DUF1801 domain-containing protein [Desulfuribacillus stibiiarsenatis]OEH86981.1 hypothetical protein BHU72_01620 [Desulfuribacillus stibiiarsenatis]
MEKDKHVPQNIDEYIALFPEDVQSSLTAIRELIKSEAPEAIEAMSYQMPTFKLNGNLVHFAAFKNHIGFYPTPSGIDQFVDELGEYEWAKGSVKFPLSRPIPFELIRKIVQYRMKENLEKKQAKK